MTLPHSSPGKYINHWHVAANTTAAAGATVCAFSDPAAVRRIYNVQSEE